MNEIKITKSKERIKREITEDVYRLLRTILTEENSTLELRTDIFNRSGCYCDIYNDFVLCEKYTNTIKKLFLPDKVFIKRVDLVLVDIHTYNADKYITVKFYIYNECYTTFVEKIAKVLNQKYKFDIKIEITLE